MLDAEMIPDVNLGYFDQMRSTNIIWGIGAFFLMAQSISVWGSVSTLPTQAVQFAGVWYTLVLIAYTGFGIYVLKAFTKRFSFGGLNVGTLLVGQLVLVSTLLLNAFGAANTNLIFGVLATIFLTAAGLLQIFFKNDYLQDKCKEGQEQDANDVVMSEHGP
ncbi:TRP C-terminal domain-containing protein [Plasmodiophora brassicae]|uniref:Uncharacterized protein n=1 Tax=Plasmodiophora brassicae TaxID=37360 RepID=A0A0G4IUP0_PLABS|nr:hypothetical protein PBRA_006925 [Plasmodiophora brassicae]SPR00568.1 unnamed protein product [Plasmodiophora brassicae]